MPIALDPRADELVLFVEAAYKLKTSPFWAWATTPRGAPDWQRLFAGDWLAHDGLSREALESFCLTLRLLIQDRDGFSIRQIGKIAEEWPENSAPYRAAARQAQEELQLRLSDRSLIEIPGQSGSTNYEVFDVVFYGGLAHMDRNKRNSFRQMANSGPFAFFVFQAFLQTLFHYNNCIQSVAYNIVRHWEAEGS